MPSLALILSDSNATASQLVRSARVLAISRAGGTSIICCCVLLAFQISEIEQPCAQMSWMVETSWGFSVKSPRKMVRDTGFEPVTPTVSRWCSTTEYSTATTSYKSEAILVSGWRQLFSAVVPLQHPVMIVGSCLLMSF